MKRLPFHAFLLMLICVPPATCQQPAEPHALVLKVNPIFQTSDKSDLHFGGFVGDRLKANLENWELRVPDSDPALVEMFYDRDQNPQRNLLPWSGEFIGKYLCASILSYKMLKDPRQKATIDKITKALIESQGPDGYLGPFDRNSRLTGKNWDIWGHYWAIRALLMYYREFNSPEALQAATRAADLIVKTFLNKGIPLTNDGSFGQMNYAVIHAFTQLYQVTGKPEYLDMANWIVKQWDLPGGGLYLKMALADREMFEFPGNRWESLHDFLGMYDMYLLTGDPKYRQAFSHIWYSILKGDRHNTGGFSSGEKTTGDPYNPGAIETCSTVAWIDMSIDMLKLTGDSRVADELELSTFNGNLGGQNPAGNWWTYNTPMDGTKEASAQTINFQCRPGSPDLNCCSVNGPRGLGLIAEWAVMTSKEGLALNYYGPSNFGVLTPSGQGMKIEQKTDYPVSGRDLIKIDLEKPETFNMEFRIPSWSNATRVTINNESPLTPKAGAYLNLKREWKNGDTLNFDFDMSLHYWTGERECYGSTSIYHGPLLLAFDPTYNSIDPSSVPELDSRTMDPEQVKTNRRIQPWVLIKVKAKNGQEIELCDFATAGAYGNFYRTWLPVRGVEPIKFDPAEPIWDARPK